MVGYKCVLKELEERKRGRMERESMVVFIAFLPFESNSYSSPSFSMSKWEVCMRTESTKLFFPISCWAFQQVHELPGWFCTKASLTYINWPLTHRKTPVSFYSVWMIFEPGTRFLVFPAPTLSPLKSTGALLRVSRKKQGSGLNELLGKCIKALT